jgi:hypothetical protein
MKINEPTIAVMVGEKVMLVPVKLEQHALLCVERFFENDPLAKEHIKTPEDLVELIVHSISMKWEEIPDPGRDSKLRMN